MVTTEPLTTFDPPGIKFRMAWTTTQKKLAGLLVALCILSSLGLAHSPNAGAVASADTSAIEVTSSTGHTCALKSDGSVACWGSNLWGQLGDGTLDNRTVPVPVTSGALTRKTVTQIATGGGHTCALMSGGSVACWGFNIAGQVGDGSTVNRLRPIVVSGGALSGKNVVQIAAGGARTCALIDDGTIACWGYLYGDGTGDNSPITDRYSPVSISDGALSGNTVTQIAVAESHICALLTGGTIACWGDNYFGQIGDGTTVDVESPRTVNSGSLVAASVTQVAVTYSHTCALTSNGKVSCWGGNYWGQLGNGTKTNVSVPTEITGDLITGETVTQIAAGNAHSCALTADGSLFCWGSNLDGELGNRFTTTTNEPILVAGGALTGKTVTQVATGGTITCSVLSDNSISCWGSNDFGQLGDGTTQDRLRPVAVVWPSRARAITKPSTTGVALVRQTLTAIKGTWTGFPTPIYTYKWYACSAMITRSVQNVPRTCWLISGAASATFRLTAAQEGKYIAVRVTGKSTGTLSTSWLSKTTTRVR